MSEHIKTEYGVGLFFDERVDAQIETFATSLLGRALPFRPHITIAKFYDANFQVLEQEVREFTRTEELPCITFSHIDTLADRGIVFIAASMTDALSSFHDRLWNHSFTTGRRHPNSPYAPARWMPHCTIGWGVNLESIPGELPPALCRPIATRLEVFRYDEIRN